MAFSGDFGRGGFDAGGAFGGAKICITGKLDGGTRADWQAQINASGGHFCSTVGRDCDVVVATMAQLKNPTNKVASARGRGVPVVSEAWLDACLHEGGRVDTGDFEFGGTRCTTMPAHRHASVQRPMAPVARKRAAPKRATPSSSPRAAVPVGAGGGAASQLSEEDQLRLALGRSLEQETQRDPERGSDEGDPELQRALRESAAHAHPIDLSGLSSKGEATGGERRGDLDARRAALEAAERRNQESSLRGLSKKRSAQAARRASTDVRAARPDADGAPMQPSGAATPAPAASEMEDEGFGHGYGSDEEADELQEALRLSIQLNASEVAQKNRPLSKGDRVRLVAGVEREDAGNLIHGRVGVIETVEQDDEPYQVKTANGKTFWFRVGMIMLAEDKEQKVVAKSQKAPTPTPTPQEEEKDDEQKEEEELPPLGLRKGDRVRLAAGVLREDAGNLAQPGKTGVIAKIQFEDDDDDAPYQVKIQSGRTFWFKAEQIVLVAAENKAHDDTQTAGLAEASSPPPERRRKKKRRAPSVSDTTEAESAPAEICLLGSSSDEDEEEDSGAAERLQPQRKKRRASSGPSGVVDLSSSGTSSTSGAIRSSGAAAHDSVRISMEVLKMTVYELKAELKRLDQPRSGDKEALMQRVQEERDLEKDFAFAQRFQHQQDSPGYDI
jgi:hypothetical protein